MDSEGMAGAVEKIAELATAGIKTTTFTHESERKGVYYVVGPDGKAVKTLADPAWHHERLGTPAELVRFIEEHKGESGVVFYGEASVVYVYDINDRRNVAVCELKTTLQYGWLLNPTGAMRQTDFIRLLRITLRGCLPPDSGLLSLVRNLKFNVTTDGGGTVQHGRESIGRSLKAELTGEGSIPEEVRLIVPVFQNHPFSALVTCAVELAPQEQTLQLTPYPMEARRAMDEALADIAERFAGDGMPPAYRGQA